MAFPMVPAFRSHPLLVSGNGVDALTQPKKVLMVNPDLAVAIIFQEKLEQAGFAVEVAGNPRLALRIIELGLVGLAVVDFGSSCFDVQEFVDAIRARPASKTLPVIVRRNPHFIPDARDAGDSGLIRWIATCDCTPGRLLRIASEMLAPEPAGTPAASVAAPPYGRESEPQPEEHAANIFMVSAPYTIARLWTAHRAFLASREDPAQRSGEITDMHRQAGVLGRAAGLAGYREIAKLACALEAHLIDLQVNPGKITGPVERMLAPAVDVLALFVQRAVNAAPKQRRKVSRSPAR